jgi:MEDS: MEthanogen/methylotroph, DcmR Sensory domain
MASSPSVASGPPKHFVQFYDGNEELLTANVGRYLGEGLRSGEGIAVIATAAHAEAFSNHLRAGGFDIEGAQRKGHAVFLSAEETLALFMVDGQPDRTLFQRAIGAVLAHLRQKTGGRALRGYGEMVGLLWNAGHSSAAAKLERLWNEILSASGIQLYCAYQIDVFGNEFQAGVIDEILCAHTHLEPGANGDLDGVVSRAMNEVLGPKAKEIKLPANADFSPAWAVMPKGESAVLWIRNNLPQYADEILARARGYYHASSTGLRN